jgi:hypothetical protein
MEITKNKVLVCAEPFKDFSSLGCLKDWYYYELTKEWPFIIKKELKMDINIPLLREMVAKKALKCLIMPNGAIYENTNCTLKDRYYKMVEVHKLLAKCNYRILDLKSNIYNCNISARMTKYKYFKDQCDVKIKAYGKAIKETQKDIESLKQQLTTIFES